MKKYADLPSLDALLGPPIASNFWFRLITTPAPSTTTIGSTEDSAFLLLLPRHANTQSNIGILSSKIIFSFPLGRLPVWVNKPDRIDEYVKDIDKIKVYYEQGGKIGLKNILTNKKYAKATIEPYLGGENLTMQEGAHDSRRAK